MPNKIDPFLLDRLFPSPALLAIVDKYGVTISQYEALLEVSMNRITMWINVRPDAWTVEMSAIASNVTG